MRFDSPISDRSSIRSLLEEFRERSDLRARRLFAVDFMAYHLILGMIVLAPNGWLKAILSLLAGVAIGRLFTLGHDACHGSFVRRRKENLVIGRLAFLPSYTPFSLWELGHNFIHHGYTNLKGKDYVWTPYSKAQFDGLPRYRRGLERAYRSAIGQGFYYCVEIWWRKLIFPQSNEVYPSRPQYLADSWLVTGYAALQILVLQAAAIKTRQNGALLILFAILFPYAIWNLMMGFVIFHHHTHPRVAWFNRREEWNAMCAQLENTVNVIFPGPINSLLHNIMDHTAHHLDVNVPLYALPAAQRVVEEHYPDDVVVQRWSWSHFLNCVRICKLYDYERHEWLDFEGRVTAVVPITKRIGRREADVPPDR